MITCALVAWVIWLQQKHVRYEEKERETNAERVNWLRTADYWMHHPAESMPELLQHLAGEDELARRSAALALSQIGPAARDSLPEIVPLIDHDDPHVRQCALLCLSRQNVDLGSWAEPIAARLVDDDSAVRETAARAVAHLGAHASPAASRILVSCDRGQSGMVMTVLSHLGTDAPEALATIHGILRDETADLGLRQVAFSTLRALEQFDAADAEAGLRSNEPVPDLTALRYPGSTGLGWASVQAISELHLTSPTLREAFRDFLARQYKNSLEVAASDVSTLEEVLDRIPAVSHEVISAAWVLGVDQSRLIPRLKGTEWGQSSVQLLREINRDEALRLLPDFLELASDENNKRNWVAWSALQGMGPDAAECLPLAIKRLHLRSSTGDGAWEWRRDEAIRLISEIGPGAKNAIPDLIALISSQNLHPDSKPSTRLDISVFGALAAIGPASKDAIPVIVAWLNEPPAEFESNDPYSQWVRRSVPPIDTLRRIGIWNPEIASCLGRLAKHDVPGIRHAALLALAELDPERSRTVDSLAAALDDPHCIVRRAAATALGGLGRAALEAIPALREAADVPENAVPPELILRGDEQILRFEGVRWIYEPRWNHSPQFVRERTVREVALEAIRQIESDKGP